MSSLNEVLHYSHSVTGVMALWQFLEGSGYKTFAGHGECLHVSNGDKVTVIMSGDTLYWWEDERGERLLAVWRDG